jgi:membrane-associated protein
VDVLGWLSPDQIVGNGGSWALWIVAAIIFAECAIMLGFFLPGDTLLFGLGMIAATGALAQPIWLICVVLCAAAVLGNLVGYEVGHRLGEAFLRGERRQLVQRRHIERTERFFEKYGGRAIVLARFVGVVRSVITVVAGAARMNRTKYITYSTVGALVWAAGLTLLGYFLGRIPFVQRNVQPHLDLFVLLAVVFTVLTVVVHLVVDRLRSRKQRTVHDDDRKASAVSAHQLVDADQHP